MRLNTTLDIQKQPKQEGEKKQGKTKMTKRDIERGLDATTQTSRVVLYACNNTKVKQRSASLIK